MHTSLALSDALWPLWSTHRASPPSVIINCGVLHIDDRAIILPSAPRASARLRVAPAPLLLALPLLLLRLRKGAEEGVLLRLPLLLLLLLGSGGGLHTLKILSVCTGQRCHELLRQSAQLITTLIASLTALLTKPKRLQALHFTCTVHSTM